MAKCYTCGENAGALRTTCDSCARAEQVEKDLAEQEARYAEAAERAKQDEQNAASVNKLVSDWKASTAIDLNAGKSIYVYDSIYLQVDSVVNGDQIGSFDIAPLQAAGLAGWKVLSVIPRTVGVGLTNVSYGSNSGETWGAGLGGNVSGVHVLLGREITSPSDSDFDGLAVEIASDVVANGHELY